MLDLTDLRRVLGLVRSNISKWTTLTNSLCSSSQRFPCRTQAWSRGRDGVGEDMNSLTSYRICYCGCAAQPVGLCSEQNCDLMDAIRLLHPVQVTLELRMACHPSTTTTGARSDSEVGTPRSSEITANRPPDEPHCDAGPTQCQQKITGIHIIYAYMYWISLLRHPLRYSVTRGAVVGLTQHCAEGSDFFRDGGMEGISLLFSLPDPVAASFS